MKHTELDKILTKASNKLPEGWQIVIRIEHGSIVLNLLDSDDLGHELQSDDAISKQISRAIVYANEYLTAAESAVK